MGRHVLDRYSNAGGGLLAGGLAYAALFAIVPAVLLLTGVLGAFVADATRRSEVLRVIVDVMPPLRDLVQAVLTEVAQNAAPVSIIGGVVLIWGASRFVVSFLEAIGRVTGGIRERGVLRQNLVAFGAVLLLIVAILGATILAGLLSFLEAGAQVGALRFVGAAISIALGLLPVIATVAAMVLVYRLVPLPMPTWRNAFVPGLIVGLVLTGLSRVFVYLAPRLLGSAALLGTLVTVFAVLAWLSLSFQAILLGAAWVRELTAPPKVDDVRATPSPPIAP